MQKDFYFGLSSRIARWKLNTAFEKWLSLKADASSFWKKYIFTIIVSLTTNTMWGGKNGSKSYFQPYSYKSNNG